MDEVSDECDRIVSTYGDRCYPWTEIYRKMVLVRKKVYDSMIPCRHTSIMTPGTLDIDDIDDLLIVPIDLEDHSISMVIYPGRTYFIYDSALSCSKNDTYDIIDEYMGRNGYERLEIDADSNIQGETGDNFCSFWTILFLYLTCLTSLYAQPIVEYLSLLPTDEKDILIRSFMSKVYEEVYLRYNLDRDYLPKIRVMMDVYRSGLPSVGVLQELSFSDVDDYRIEHHIPRTTEQLHLYPETSYLVLFLSNHIKSIRDLNIISSMKNRNLIFTILSRYDSLSIYESLYHFLPELQKIEMSDMKMIFRHLRQYITISTVLEEVIKYYFVYPASILMRERGSIDL